MSVFKAKSGVIELSPINFQGKKIIHPKLQDNMKGLVAFTCLWCGYCKQLAPPYTATSVILGASFPLFNVDCVKYKDLATKMGITSYPSIFWIDKTGKITKPYNGKRDTTSFISEICKEAKVCK